MSADNLPVSLNRGLLPRGRIAAGKSVDRGERPRRAAAARLNGRSPETQASIGASPLPRRTALAASQA